MTAPPDKDVPRPEEPAEGALEHEEQDSARIPHAKDGATANSESHESHPAGAQQAEKNAELENPG